MDHELLALLKQYVLDFDELKDRHGDIDNVAFNRHFGLLIDPPADWPNLEIIAELIHWAEQNGVRGTYRGKKVLIIYPDTSTYDQISKLIQTKVNYFAWHELAVAMNRAAADMQHIRSLRSKIESADLVIFIGVMNALPEVVDQVRGFCTSCLILLG